MAARTFLLTSTWDCRGWQYQWGAHPTAQESSALPSTVCPIKEGSALTGTRAGCALPEGILVGDLGKALAQLLSTLWRGTRSLVAQAESSVMLNAGAAGRFWGQDENLLPFKTSRSGILALSMGVSPYLFAMLTKAPLPTRS